MLTARRRRSRGHRDLPLLPLRMGLQLLLVLLELQYDAGGEPKRASNCRDGSAAAAADSEPAVLRVSRWQR